MKPADHDYPQITMAAAVITLLQENPNSTALALVAGLRATGVVTTRTEINKILYSAQQKGECVSDGETPPKWTWAGLEEKGAPVQAARRGANTRDIKAALRRCTAALADLTRLIEVEEQGAEIMPANGAGVATENDGLQ
jgi:hypothetical protein